MVLIWLQGKMKQKFWQNIYHKNLNIDLIKKDVIQINGGITINAYVSVNFMYVKKIILGILLHAVVKMRNI